MTDTARPPAAADATPLPDLVLYTRDGCHLCDEARDIVRALLAERAARGVASPALVELDITSNPDWERAYFASIPVLEFGGERLELAMSASRIRRLLERAT